MKVTPEQLERAFSAWILDWQKVPAVVAAAGLIDLKTVDPDTFGRQVTPYFVDLLHRQGCR